MGVLQGGVLRPLLYACLIDLPNESFTSVQEKNLVFTLIHPLYMSESPKYLCLYLSVGNYRHNFTGFIPRSGVRASFVCMSIPDLPNSIAQTMMCRQ